MTFLQHAFIPHPIPYAMLLTLNLAIIMLALWQMAQLLAEGTSLFAVVKLYLRFELIVGIVNNVSIASKFYQIVMVVPASSQMLRSCL